MNVLPILFWCQPHHPGDAEAAEDFARILARAGNDVVMAWGGPDPPVLPGVRVAPLPPARPSAPDRTLVLTADGIPMDHAWKKRRAAATLALSARISPRLLVLDRYPFARRAFRFEVRPLLEIASRRTPRPIILSWDPGTSAEPDDPARLATLRTEALPLIDHILTGPAPQAADAAIGLYHSHSHGNAPPEAPGTAGTLGSPADTADGMPPFSTEAARDGWTGPARHPNSR